jgi:hypothetical protein
MRRALLSLLLSVLLAVFGVVATTPAHALLPRPQTIAVGADASEVSACADHDRGSPMSACGSCVAICASATAAILPPDALSLKQDDELELLALSLEFSDRRIPPAKSPPRI